MSADSHHKIIARIRKMLRLANDAGAAEGERDNALRMAHATMAKYNLDVATIEEAEPHKESGEPRIEEGINFSTDVWARRVGGSVARLFMCAHLYTRRPSRHFFIGRHANAVTASLMAQFLVRAIAREARRYQREIPKAAPTKIELLFPEFFQEARGSAVARSFSLGAAVRLNERVRELLRSSAKQTSAFSSSSGTALTLLDLRQREELCNEGFMLTRYPHLAHRTHRGRSCTYVDGLAFSAGKSYAENLSLQRQIDGNKA